MDLYVRRRELLKMGGGKIEKPDYFRFDFTTSAANEEIQIGSWVASKIDDCILDGVTQTPTFVGGRTKIVTHDAGEHTLYYHLSDVVPTNYDLNFVHSASYVRLPYDVSVKCLSTNIQCGAWANKWDVIDILDTNLVDAVKANGYKTYSKADVVNVPIGSKQVYIDAGVSAAVLQKINEVNFDY